MTYYLYILYSTSADLYYVGTTNDPERRLIEHNSSPLKSFTSKYRPLQLVAVFEAGSSRGEAEQIEKFIKKQKSRKFILRLIQEDFVPNGKLSQLVRVPKLRD